MFRKSTRGRTAVLAALALATATITFTSTAGASDSGTGGFSGQGIAATSHMTAAKSTTGALAQTDPTLLGRTDSTPVNVMVKLDYDASASYTGDIAGLPATSPRVTGHKLSGKTAAEKTYSRYVSKIDSSFRGDLAAAIPGATAGRSLQHVYGGVAVKLPADADTSIPAS